MIDRVAKALEPKFRGFGQGDMPMAIAREVASAAIEAIAEQPDYRSILLNLIASLTLADGLGDVSAYVDTAAKLARFDFPEWSDLEELGDILGEINITTLYGTSLGKN